MGAFSAVSALLLAVLYFQTFWKGSVGSYPIAGSDYEYQLLDDQNKTCLYASFVLKFTIYYVNETHNLTSTLDVPSKDKVVVSGQCNESRMALTWLNQTNFTVTVQFDKDTKHWWLSRFGINFTFDNPIFTTQEQGEQSFWTEEGEKLFSRSFHTDEYFYCKSRKTYFLTDSLCNGSTCEFPCLSDNATCSFVEMNNAVLYPGDISGDKPSKKLCEQDYVHLQEIIVPVVVGGVLALLLISILVAYLVAYFRRKRKEASARYEHITE